MQKRGGKTQEGGLARKNALCSPPRGGKGGGGKVSKNEKAVWGGVGVSQNSGPPEKKKHINRIVAANKFKGIGEKRKKRKERNCVLFLTGI